METMPAMAPIRSVAARYWFTKVAPLPIPTIFTLVAPPLLPIRSRKACTSEACHFAPEGFTTLILPPYLAAISIILSSFAKTKADFSSNFWSGKI